jgi:hypothetical protein
MRPEIIHAAAQQIAAAWLKSDAVDAGSILVKTVRTILVEPVAVVLQALEQSRDALTGSLQRAAALSGRDMPEELPKPTGLPAIDTNELSKKVAMEKPVIVSLLGKSALTAHARRKLELECDRGLLEFLSFYANRLRRWMQQTIETMRSAFAANADVHRAQFAGEQSIPPEDRSAIEEDAQTLREWNVVVHAAR